VRVIGGDGADEFYEAIKIIDVRPVISNANRSAVKLRARFDQGANLPHGKLAGFEKKSAQKVRSSTYWEY
jgi:hypothetical protein